LLNKKETTVTILSKCALIATIAATGIAAPSAFAQSYPLSNGYGGTLVDGSAAYGLYDTTVQPGMGYWHAPEFTGGGSIGNNELIHTY
jgi:hypothetical protein